MHKQTEQCFDNTTVLVYGAINIQMAYLQSLHVKMGYMRRFTTVENNNTNPHLKNKSGFTPNTEKENYFITV